MPQATMMDFLDREIWGMANPFLVNGSNVPASGNSGVATWSSFQFVDRLNYFSCLS
jgi:hypothetical protein